MILLLLIAALLQRPGALLPGTGIVMGTIAIEGGGAPAGIRVAAVAVDDPSSLASVTETDASGNYRLLNIPEGKYFIVAGRLDSLTYFPGGSDRGKASVVTVESAKIVSIASFTVPAGSKRLVTPKFSLPQSDSGTAAYLEIKAQRNPEAKKKLLQDFDKKFPKSSRLAEVYIEFSRLLASQSDFSKANQYAEKAVAAVNSLKVGTPPEFDRSWHDWVASLEISARDNLTWTRQMVAWQQRQIHSATLGRR